MDYYITQEDLGQYITLPQNFDWDIVDQEQGFNKLFKIIPQTVYLSLKDETTDQKKEIFRLLTKASVLYSFVLSIPKMKVHINNTGINQFEQQKLKTAPWWDVRDLGLAFLKFGDSLISKALTEISKTDLKTKIPFFAQTTEYITTPAEIESIFSINNSPEVFLMLQRYLKQALLLKIQKRINSDCLVLVKANELLNDFLKDAIVFYALYYASQLPAFVFLHNAIAIQYEELPWQKSMVMDPEMKIKSGLNFMKLADESLKVITDYMRANLTEFPCYSPPDPEFQMQAKPSGIYLI